MLKLDFFSFQPATVSRCGMIYLEPSSLGWRPFFKSWLNVFPEVLAKEALDLVEATFEWLVDPCLEFIRKNTKVRSKLLRKLLPLTSSIPSVITITIATMKDYCEKI